MQKCLQLCTTNLDENCYWLNFAAVLVCLCLWDCQIDRGIKFGLYPMDDALDIGMVLTICVRLLR